MSTVGIYDATMSVNNESFVFGLGYFHHDKQEQAQRDLNGPPQQGSRSTTVCDAASAADMAQALMMQCLAYHQEQEAIRQHADLRGQTWIQEPEAFPQFVSSSSQTHPQLHHCQDQSKGETPLSQPYENPQQQTTTQSQPYENTEQQTTTQQQPDTFQAINKNEIYSSDCKSSEDTPKGLESLIEAARARARAVLAQFNQTGESPLTSSRSRVGEEANNSASASELLFHPQTHHEPQYYAQQREIGWQREEQRRRRALLKNFEYVVHKESERVGKLQAAQDQAAQWERIGQQQYQRNLQIRSEQLQSQKRHQSAHDNSQRKSKRTRSDEQNQPQEKRSVISVAIYVSGLPVVEPNVVSEDFVRQLFGTYGEIARVHLYRDRTNHTLKGDGLIVYSIDEQADAASFLGSVCGQCSLFSPGYLSHVEKMNGAELSCGSVLRVEQARTNRDTELRQKRQTQLSNEKPMQARPADTEACTINVPREGEKECAVADPELDDFFDSL